MIACISSNASYSSVLVSSGSLFSRFPCHVSASSSPIVVSMTVVEVVVVVIVEVEVEVVVVVVVVVVDVGVVMMGGAGDTPARRLNICVS